MSLFAVLSKYVVLPIITDWIDIFEIVNLDVALCNKQHRTIYLKNLNDYPRLLVSSLITRPGIKLPLSNILLGWCRNRNIESFYDMRIFNNELLTLDMTAGFKFDQVLSITCNRLKDYNIHLMMSLIQACKGLQKLKLTKSKSIGDLLYALPFCSALTTCNLFKCEGVTDLQVEELCRHCVCLTDLNVEGCFGLTSTFLLTCVVQCSSLSRLNIKLRTDTPYFRRSLGILILHRARLLTEMTCDILRTIDMKALLWFSNCKLEKLDAANCTRVTGETVSDLSELCPVLRDLNLSCCSFNESVLYTIASQLQPTLRVLELTFVDCVTDNVLIKFLSKSPLLEECSLCGNDLISVDGTASIAQFCLNLRKLTLHFVKICDDVLFDIFSKCTKIKDFSVSSGQVTDKTISLIAPLCEKLQILDLSGCQHISDEALFSLSFYCLSLISLNLSGRKDLSNRSIHSVLLHCIKLQRLGLSGICSVDNATINILCNLGKKLQILDVTGCEGSISQTTIIRLINTLGKCKLRELRCDYDFMDKFYSVYPNLHICSHLINQ